MQYFDKLLLERHLTVFYYISDSGKILTPRMQWHSEFDVNIVSDVGFVACQVPSLYLNQCWLINHWGAKYSAIKMKKKKKHFQENAFQDESQMSVILLSVRPQCVNL